MSKPSKLKDKLNVKDIFNNYRKEYGSKAEEYIKDPDKLNSLYEKSTQKAKNSKGSLSGIWDELKLLFELIKDWKNGNYRKIPRNSLIMIIIALIYFLVPTDTIIDAIPILGLVDDATVLGFVIRQVTVDLEEYQKWKYSK